MNHPSHQPTRETVAEKTDRKQFHVRQALLVISKNFALTLGLLIGMYGLEEQLRMQTGDTTFTGPVRLVRSWMNPEQQTNVTPAAISAEKDHTATNEKKRS